MKKDFFNLIVIASFFLLMLGGFFDQTEATTITFEYNYEFSGATSPSGTGPWLVATFEDVSGGVQLTLTSNLSGKEFVGNDNGNGNGKKGWYFNFDPTLNPKNLSFSNIGGTAAKSINKGVNAFKADGDGYYDIEFSWGANKFGEGSSVTYLITYPVSISAESFNFLSSPGSEGGGGHGPYLSAAHIQGIGPSGNDSGWIAPVPEPSTFLLLGIGLVSLGLFGRRKLRKRS